MSYPYSDQFGTSDFMNESQQQLSPTTGYPQWETIEHGEQQQHQQHQIESPLDTTMDSTTPTGPTPIAFRSINLEMDDMNCNIMPGQTTNSQIDNTPIHLHHPHALHQQLHHHQQQQQQFHQQQQQYHRQQSRHLSLEPFSTQISRPGSAQHQVTISPVDTLPPQTTSPLTPNPPTESTSNTTGGRHTSRKTSGPIRSSSRVTRAQQQAPYFRPSPASTTASYLGLEVPRAGSSASSTPRIPQQSEPQPRKQTIRFTPTPGPIRTRAASRAAASSMMPSPVPTPISQPPECEGSTTTPRQAEIAFSPMTRRLSRAQSTTTPTQAPQQPTSAHSQSPPQANPSSHPKAEPQVQTRPPQASSAATRSHLHARRHHPLNITSDMHYSQSSNILHASLELPGVKKQDVHMKLATCYFNHVKFISVLAETAPVFNLPGMSGGGEQAQAQDTSSGTKQTPQTSISINADLRERRFGSLKRIIQVPSTTKLEDIDASMEDGVLSLKIYCGKPYELDDEQTILIR